MHIISKPPLEKFWVIHPESKVALQRWYTQVSHVKWRNFPDVRETFPSADLVSNFIVFDIGRDYRLITLIDFQFGKVFIRNVLTHSDYDKNK
jgi:mRNA interferase HigB